MLKMQECILKYAGNVDSTGLVDLKTMYFNLFINCVFADMSFMCINISISVSIRCNYIYVLRCLHCFLSVIKIVDAVISLHSYAFPQS